MKLKKSLLRITAWGLLLAACNERRPVAESVSKQDSVTAVGKLKLPNGFHAEHLYSPSENQQGSWVSMTFDAKGRMIASDQYGAMYRLTLPPIGANDTSAIKIEKLAIDIPAGKNGGKLAIGYAQGLVWAFNSLYVVVNHRGDSMLKKTSGLYRLQDTDEDDTFDKITLLKSLVGEEEHGPHSLKLGPDGRSLYVVAGNHTALPEGITNYRLPPVWQRDNILPDNFERDPRTADAAGWIARTDSAGKNWELISAGLRNTFDIAFNRAGDMFTYDSDMEWDIGMPWYRPTRICHVTSGSEFGWRDGNGKWSSAYLDNVPPLLNIGQGSPTNVVSAHEARFPEKYANSILAFDWSFGIIYAIDLVPQGASYKATAEEFISAAPLPVTDGVIGPDGALYFLTGGRRIESHLYRVYYDRGDGPLASANDSLVITPENKLRGELEKFHGKPDPAAINVAWPHLKHPDRYVRYAARIAVEHQPISQWRERVLTETDPEILINAMVALARHGSRNLSGRMLQSLMSIDYTALPPAKQFDALRAFELIFSRFGRPSAADASSLISYLGPHYPAASQSLNRSLSKLLAFIEDPAVVAKTIPLLESAVDDSTAEESVSKSSDLILRNPQYGMDLAGVLASTPPSQQIHYAVVLSETGRGWTPPLQERYFRWFHKAYTFRGGRHYVGHIDKAREAALKRVPKNQYTHFDTLSTNTQSVNQVIDWVRIMSDGGPGRRWKLEEALDTVQTLSGRNFTQAKNMFTAAACINCHGMRGEGGSLGPDLTQLSTRFSKKDILESIIDPNKAISDQYSSTVFILKDGSSVMGKLAREDKEKYYISQNPFDPQNLRQLDKQAVASRRPADVSMMPPNLINQLNPERLRDLMAYLIAGGNPDHPVFSAAGDKASKK